ncbi:polyprenol monophosphomannose synthase [Homoserinimonas sp. OAct 916]|uniref:polyprenol monophosphomannose synthase n=1 Tax=Homoserinimonas sp. OAct 916 TaxID=2211450 RepID=UPI000DBE86A1|nr:polyprenol monophosphomannose synthase [Homoserinimonas sp. OAct 916]
MSRTVVLIPTYNERENLAEMVSRVLDAVPTADVLVIDDSSPDGTGEIADRLAADDSRVHVLHRTGKLGLGSAYVAAFEWGLARGYDLLVEMDADGSHPPERLPAMLEAASRPATSVRGAGPVGEAVPVRGAEPVREAEPVRGAGPLRGAAPRAGAEPGAGKPVGLVIGSRWVPGGEVTNWPKRRVWLSRAANTYAGLVLGIRVKDSTAGFRVFRAEVLRELPLQAIDSKGYCFQVDMTLRVLDAGYRVVEMPINFHERQHGESKMSGDIVAEAMWRITGWGWQRRVLRRRSGRSLRP